MHKIPPPVLNNAKHEHYGALDGIRAYSAIGIVLMHVISNIPIKPSVNYLTSTIIPFFTDFTLLFMMVSGFSLCCGYYERIKSGNITPERFYKKRYSRILPYFGLLCFLDFIISPSWESLYEVYANLTLCFNLLPNPKIEVIGVGWFLGVVFLFYMLFPFFVFMIDNKRRAWKSLIITLVFVAIAITYFYTPQFISESPGRKNIIFCAPLFIVGGIMYLYRKNIVFIVSKYVWLVLSICFAYTILYFIIPTNGFVHYLVELILFALWLFYAIGSKDIFLNNSIVRYLSSISMEIYLAHMVIYRIIERIHIENIISQPDLYYISMCILVLLGVIVFAHIMKFYVLVNVVKRMEK